MKNKRERLDFAEAHKHWTTEDWKRVIWSDECKINRICSDGVCWVWTKPKELLTERTVTPTLKFCGGKIMVWGCFGYNGVGNLVKIDGSMDGALFRRIIVEDLNESIEELSEDTERAIFQMDNDPKHTAKATTELLRQQPYEVMTWPPQSPDLNPIEQLWSYLKNQLGKYETDPSGVIELWERVQVEWHKIPVELCRKLVESMPNRIAQVIKIRVYGQLIEMEQKGTTEKG